MINRKERLLRAVENGFHSISEGTAPVLDECRTGCAEDYTIYGRTQVGKNLLKYPYYNTTKTTNGITFTDNGDGTVTANGTATANVYFYIQGVATNTPLEKGKYWLSGCPEGGSELTYCLNAANKNDTGSGIAIMPNGTLPYACTIIIKTGTVCDNLVFRPQLEEGEGATEYEPYTEEKVGDRTRNLLPYPYSEMPAEGESTIERNGITYTYNGDGSITANGTATVATLLYLKRYGKAPAEKGYLSGCPAGGTGRTYKVMMSFYKNGKRLTQFDDTGNGRAVDVSNLDYSDSYITIVIYANYKCTNVTFKPQFELSKTATDYEPYGYKIPISVNGENRANIYLTAPLGSGESVSFSDGNMPELPLPGGTNTVTVGTEIPPEKISVKYISKGKKY